MLEEIIVQARRTTESVQEVPLTVNVISADALEAKGVTQLSNIGTVVPNLVWVDSGGGTLSNKVSLRGIYSNANSQGFDPGVAIYLDDVYVGNQFGFNSALLDIDRIEVLKGPQGTLFGRNAAAGAITVHTTRPSTDEFSAVASGRVGNYDLREARLLLNAPLSKMAAVKGSFIYRDRGGYQRNALDGRRDLNDEHFYGGRLQLLIEPSERFEALATLEYFKNDDHQNVLSCAAGAGALPCPNANVDAVLSDGLAADNNSTTQRTTWGATLKADWRPGAGLEMTSITAYRDIDVRQDQDQDYSAVDFIRSGFRVPKDWQFSQELRLATDQETRLRGVVGLFYFHEDRTTQLPLTFTQTALASIGVNAPRAFLQVTDSRLKTTSWAAFGQGQFDVLPTLTAELGFRYARDEKDFTYEQTENDILALIPPPLQAGLFLVPFPRSSASASFSKPTYTGSVTWRAAETVRAYVRYATGFKAGGFQAATNSASYNPLVPFGPENSRQWEVGLKSELADGRVRFNAAAFRTSYDDTQVQLIDASTFQKVVGNLGSARARGLELELSAALAPGLTFDGNLGLQRARFVSGPFDGRRFQYSPRRTASASLTYERAIVDDWQVFASGTVSYRSAINLNTEASGSPGFLSSPGVTLVNARVGVEREDGRLGVYLWGTNLADERRLTDFIPQGPVQPPSYFVSTPRTYGVEVTTRF
ncbi:TonB-dependent receptor [Phenylobacterium sp.]|uniref:TonB-dependent receptor n=1 Tax=Phenylobacterium sp. TaxID=1871053 RepID=UPI002EDB763B